MTIATLLPGREPAAWRLLPTGRRSIWCWRPWVEAACSSGVAAAVKLTRPEVRVIGVEPELASDAAQSMKAGVQIVVVHRRADRRTAADGLRTQSVGELNFAHMQAYVDDIVTVTEAGDSRDHAANLFGARLVPEPSGAVALAAALFHRRAVALCPANGGDFERRQRRALRARSVLRKPGSLILLTKLYPGRGCCPCTANDF